MHALALSAHGQPLLPSHQALICLQAALQLAGWELLFLDIDLLGDSPIFDARVERNDGLWVHARVDAQGRCSMERNRRHRWLGKSRGMGGRIPLAPQVSDEFLGRSNFTGPRAMARHLSDYIAANSTGLTIEQMRNAWRPALNFGAKFIATPTGDSSHG